MTEPHTLSLGEAARAIVEKKLSSLELVQSCLKRVEAREGQIQAFEYLDADYVLQQAKQRDNEASKGSLHGVPIGVKDIIDTCDMPTARGSSIYAGRQPVSDASCVALCRAAGAVIFGKTVTTEFAYFFPGKTKNPHNLEHTPGGSSMGSAAVVADHMLPFAFGSQTAASITRPAAYCGITGYKASYGSFDLQGVFGVSQSLDTLGFMVRDLADIPIARRVLCGDDTPFAKEHDESPFRIGFTKTPHWSETDQATRTMFENTISAIAAVGGLVEPVELPAHFGELVETHKTVMAFEAARARAFEYEIHREKLSPQFVALMEQGRAISWESYQAAQRLATQCRIELAKIFETCDLLLAPSAPGEAPHGLHATGDPLFSRLWTLLHVPSITIPCGQGESGLPLGIQAIGPMNGDIGLVANVEWIQKRIV